MIFRHMKPDGAQPLRPANLMKARFVFAGRTGHIDGIWTAAFHCELRMETSSNGMALSQTSKTESASKKPCGATSIVWQKPNDWATSAASEWKSVRSGYFGPRNRLGFMDTHPGRNRRPN